jgi:hypothetical protein
MTQKKVFFIITCQIVANAIIEITNVYQPSASYSPERT